MGVLAGVLVSQIVVTFRTANHRFFSTLAI